MQADSRTYGVGGVQSAFALLVFLACGVGVATMACADEYQHLSIAGVAEFVCDVIYIYIYTYIYIYIYTYIYIYIYIYIYSAQQS
jgi:hypothetical protein